MVGTSVNMAVNTNFTEAIDFGGMTLYGVHIPSGFNGGSITLQTCLTLGGTYYAVQDGAGNNYTVIVSSPACYVPVDPVKTKGIRYCRVVSNTNANTNFSIVLSVQ